MRWLIGVIGVIIVLAIAAGVAGTDLLNGGPAPMRTTTHVVQTPVATVAPIVPTRPPVPKPVGIGQPVRNGSLVFTVQGTRRATRVYDQFGGYVGAGGEFIIVTITVFNAGPQAVMFFPSGQSLVVGGYRVIPEPMSTAFLNYRVNDVIQHGLTFSEELALNVSVGTQPEAILLSDLLGSSPSAAKVKL